MSNTMTTTHGDFIMRPTVDVCFVGLMENPIVRKGFCAAIMRVSPDMIQSTELLPTHLRRDNANDKLGILDVRVRLLDGIQLNLEMQVRYYEFWDERALFYLCKMFAEQLRAGEEYENLKKCIQVSILDFVHFPDDTECYRTIQFVDQKTNIPYSDKLELQILELKKLPKDIQTGDDLINWMHFLNGKSKEDFENMAKTNEYLEEAYGTLQKLSADDLKRYEYEEREKAIRDYNWMVNNERRARERAERATKEAEQAEKEAERAVKKAEEAERIIREAERATKEAEQAEKEAERAVKKAEEAERIIREAERATKEAEQAAKEAERAAKEAERAAKETIQKAEKIAKETIQKAEQVAKETIQKAEQEAEKIGEKHGIQLTKQVFQLHEQKKTEQEIAAECQITIEKVREILE